MQEISNLIRSSTVRCSNVTTQKKKTTNGMKKNLKPLDRYARYPSQILKMSIFHDSFRIKSKLRPLILSPLDFTLSNNTKAPCTAHITLTNLPNVY